MSRKRKSLGDEQRARHSELSGEPGQKDPTWPESAFVDLFFPLYLSEVHSICTTSSFGKLQKSFPSRRNFSGCKFTVNRSGGILNIQPCQQRLKT